jgi:lipoprotein-releasing system permease protein
VAGDHGRSARHGSRGHRLADHVRFGAGGTRRGEPVSNLTGVVPNSYFVIVRLPDYIDDEQQRLTSEDIVTGARHTLTISGLLDFGNRGTNLRAAFISSHTAQALIWMVGGVTSVDVTVKNIYAADAVVQRISAAHPVQADSWIKFNSPFLSAMRAQIVTALMM